MSKQINKVPHKTLQRQLKLILVKFMLPVQLIALIQLIQKLQMEITQSFNQEFINLAILLKSITQILFYLAQDQQHQFQEMDYLVLQQVMQMESGLQELYQKLEPSIPLHLSKLVFKNTLEIVVILLYSQIFLQGQVVIEQIIQLVLL